VLHLPRFSCPGSGKRRRVQDNYIETLALPRQPRQNSEDIIGEEAMAVGGEAIADEVVHSAGERFAGKIDAERLRSGEAGDDRERAGISETIEQTPRSRAPNDLAVLALVEEETYGISSAEI
jgi:hypothetical protein